MPLTISNEEALLDPTRELIRLIQQGGAIDPIRAEELFYQGAHLPAREQTGQTALHSAARHGDIAMVQRLLDARANVNAEDHTAETSRYWHYTFERGVSEVRITPLHEAAAHGHADICTRLIAAGADINATTTSKSTPLHGAVYAGQLAAVKVLLGADADCDAINYYNQAALHLAARAANSEIALALISAGVNVNVQGRFKQTPMHVAIAEAGATADNFCTVLLDADAKTNLKDAENRTPLHLAVLIDNVGAASVLIQRKADRRLSSRNKGTLLDLAKELEHHQIVFMLNAADAREMLQKKWAA